MKREMTDNCACGADLRDTIEHQTAAIRIMEDNNEFTMIHCPVCGELWISMKLISSAAFVDDEVALGA
jgi:hypothetical protein